MVDQLLSLDAAAKALDPSGKLTVRSLRTEIANGRLETVRIAGKIFIRESALDDFLERATVPARSVDTSGIANAGKSASVRRAEAAVENILQTGRKRKRR